MNDAIVTVMGFVAAEPYYEVLDSGMQMMSLRVGSTPRRYDRDLGQWRDEEPLFLTVNCWRGLAENLLNCELKKGDPLIVTGKLRIREYTKDGQRRFSAQVEAQTIGHDLSRGVARFQRAQRAGLTQPEDRRRADDAADRWLDPDKAETIEATTDSTETTEDNPFRAVA